MFLVVVVAAFASLTSAVENQALRGRVRFFSLEAMISSLHTRISVCRPFLPRLTLTVYRRLVISRLRNVGLPFSALEMPLAETLVHGASGIVTAQLAPFRTMIVNPVFQGQGAGPASPARWQIPLQKLAATDVPGVSGTAIAKKDSRRMEGPIRASPKICPQQYVTLSTLAQAAQCPVQRATTAPGAFGTVNVPKA